MNTRVTATVRSTRLVVAAAVTLALLTAWASAKSVTMVIDGSVAVVFTMIFGILFTQQVLAYTERPKRASPLQRLALNRLKVVVAVPVYNEDPAALAACLRSLLEQIRCPQVVAVVDDGSTKAEYGAVRTAMTVLAAQRGVEFSWVRQPNSGKRSAQHRTFAAYPDADVYMTSDSDGIFDSLAVSELLKPFVDSQVSSVAGIVHAVNNRTTLLARITDLLWVTVQLSSRSAMSRLGCVLVNSGPIAVYRGDVIRKHLGGYLTETFMGRRVEFSDDSLLTLYAALEGRTVQQPTAHVFALMPENVSHHIRQYLRWMRGSTIRSVWRMRYLPKTSIAYWAHLLTWLQFVLVLAMVGMVFIIQPLVHANWSAVWYGLGAGVSVGYLGTLRYLLVGRSDESDWGRLMTWLLAPLAIAWNSFALRPIRLYGIATCLRTGWGTRQEIEVTLRQGLS